MCVVTIRGRGVVAVRRGAASPQCRRRRSQPHHATLNFLSRATFLRIIIDSGASSRRRTTTHHGHPHQDPVLLGQHWPRLRRHRPRAEPLPRARGHGLAQGQLGTLAQLQDHVRGRGCRRRAAGRGRQPHHAHGRVRAALPWHPRLPRRDTPAREEPHPAGTGPGLVTCSCPRRACWTTA
jgi:hypothetical protein